jgi:tubulin delta
MPILTLQIGQCGNQLGATFLAEVFRRNPKDVQYFHATTKIPVARAILVDAETKVTDVVMAFQKGWKYDTRFRINLKEGAGNCWTIGYEQDSQRRETY